MVMQAMSVRSGPPDLSRIAEGLFGGRVNRDPRFAVLLEMLRPPEAALPPAPPAAGVAPIKPEPGDGPVDQATGARVAPAAIADAIAGAVQAERDELRRRNAVLAAALGACELCWGDDATCPSCGGNGAPGGSAVDAELFARYVRPAVLSLKHTNPAPRASPTSEGE